MSFVSRFRNQIGQLRKPNPITPPPWTYPDVARMFVFLASDDFQILILFGFEHHFHLLPDLDSRHHLFIQIPWHATGHSFKFSRRCLEQLNPSLPISNITWLCNTEEEMRSATRAGWRAIFVSNNCWLDEGIFKPNDAREEDRPYDLAINCRPETWKRPFLASEVARLAVIRGICWIPDDFWDLRQLDPLYMNQHLLPPDEVVNVLNQSLCGGAFSQREGACRASSEYLMCGLPVVSTPSLGGRDVWYSPDNSIICQPTPAAVKRAVDEIKDGLQKGRFHRERIRERHLELAGEMRDRFNREVQKLFVRFGVPFDAGRYLDEIFVNGMHRIIPLAHAKRLVKMGAAAMDAQWETGHIGERATAIVIDQE